LMISLIELELVSLALFGLEVLEHLVPAMVVLHDVRTAMHVAPVVTSVRRVSVVSRVALRGPVPNIV